MIIVLYVNYVAIDEVQCSNIMYKEHLKSETEDLS